VNSLAERIHGQAAKRGDPDAPKCVSCHDSIHEVKAASEADSMIARKNLAYTCAKCHSDAGFLSRHKIPVAHPVDSYKQSVHARAVALGKEAAACSSCHGSHNIFPATDARSMVNHWKVPETCGQCHKGANEAKYAIGPIHARGCRSDARKRQNRHAVAGSVKTTPRADCPFERRPDTGPAADMN
jgi:hypothetical protein